MKLAKYMNCPCRIQNGAVAASEMQADQGDVYRTSNHQSGSLQMQRETKGKNQQVTKSLSTVFPKDGFNHPRKLRQHQKKMCMNTKI